MSLCNFMCSINYEVKYIHGLHLTRPRTADKNVTILQHVSPHRHGGARVRYHVSARGPYAEPSGNGTGMPLSTAVFLCHYHPTNVTY